MRGVLNAVCIAALTLAVSPALANPGVTDALNTLRGAQSRPALRHSERLEAVAQAHADDMAQHGYFAHQGRNGSSIGERITAGGYRWCFAAENIAKGQKTLQAVLQGWANSPGHYKNMTHQKAREYGLARAPGNTWVMVLAAPC